MKPLSVNDIRERANEIADLYEMGDKTLTQSALEVLSRGEYTPEQIKRICEEANVTQYLREFERAEPPRKNIVFKRGPADSGIVIKELTGEADVIPLAERKMLKEAAVEEPMEPQETRNIYHDLVKTASVLSSEVMDAEQIYDDAANHLAGQAKYASAEVDSFFIRSAIEKVAGEKWISNLALYEISQRNGASFGKQKMASGLRINENHPLVQAMRKFASAAKDYAVKEIAYKNAKTDLDQYTQTLSAQG